MVLHALLDGLAILCRPLIAFGAIDEMDDAVDLRSAAFRSSDASGLRPSPSGSLSSKSAAMRRSRCIRLNESVLAVPGIHGKMLEVRSFLRA
jgi:hypothetical protein